MFGNLLEDALSVIPSQAEVQYLQAVSRTTNAAGYDENQFAPPVPVELCSVQAVPRTRYEVLGLDYQKDYVTWYVPRAVVGLQRNTSGDRMTWNGMLYQLQNETDWSGQDGWTAVICVRIGYTNAGE